MGRSQELSEFQRGTVIGCHLCNKSSREISSLLNIPQSTVSSIITKWKRLGTTATQPRSGRPRKVTERELPAKLKPIAHKGPQNEKTTKAITNHQFPDVLKSHYNY
uniref:Sleeping Beauty transposase HTH domain-containing protein n=1 Tax=Myripristis murdjan TaxID=586833 RepID=A0A668AM17_9TELE